MKCIACIIGILLSAVSTLASDYKLTFCVKAEDALSEDGVCVVSGKNGSHQSKGFKVNQSVVLELGKGQYDLEIFLPGCKKYTKEILLDEDCNLGNVMLETETLQLEGASVSAGSNHLSVINETISYDVSSDPTNRTRPLKKILTELPFVKLAGAKEDLEVTTGTFLITVNGRKNLAINNSNVNYVAELLQGKNIRSISINLAPTGEFSRYSAVIDIVTDTSLLNDFVAGNIGISGSDAVNARANAAVTVKSGKLVAVPSYSYNYSDARMHFNESQRTPANSSDPVYHNADTVKSDRGGTHRIGLDMSYDFSSKDVLFADASFSHNCNNKEKSSVFYRGDELISAQAANISGKSQNLSANISYQHRFGGELPHSLTAQYSLGSNRNNTLYDLSGIYSDNNISSLSQTMTLDYYRMVNMNLNYYATAGYTNRHYKSTSGAESLLDYRQSVLFARANVSYRIKKLMLSGELTLDHTQDIRTDNTALYNIRVSYPVAAGHMLLFNTSYYIYKPELSYLNSYQDNSVAGSSSFGNPDLEAQKTLSFMLLYRMFVGNKFDFSPLVSYLRSRTGTYDVYHLDPSDGILQHTTMNTGASEALNVGFSTDWNPVDALQLQLMSSASRQTYNVSEENQRYWTYVMMFNCSYSPSSRTRLECNVTWQNPDMSIAFIPQAKVMHNLWRFSVSASQKIGKRLRVYAILDQPWSSYEKQVRELNVDSYNVLNTSYITRTRISVGLNWNFGALRARVKFNDRNFYQYDDHKMN